MAVGLLVALPIGAAAAPSTAGATPAPPPAALNALTVLRGSSLHHSFTPGGTTSVQTETLSHPDDITRLGEHLFVGFQNGVGPQGEPSTDGNTASTIVELTQAGRPVSQWDVTGKADGVTADPDTGQVLVTVNEDADSSLYAIDPGAPAARQVTHYSYAAPLAHGGGTDAITIDRGQILISASAPGTTSASPPPQPTFPAVYRVTLHPATGVADTTPLFYDEDRATLINPGAQHGQKVALALTDPDSNEIVPAHAAFGGDFMLTSQGDQQQIFVSQPGTGRQALSVLDLSQSVDDTAWPSGPAGILYGTDSTHDTVVAVTGNFRPYQPVAAATPCGSNSAPATCPAPPAYPANYLATIDPSTGQVSRLTVGGDAFTPQGGLVWVRYGHRPAGY